ncbi:TIGR01457 family HAD-type hydrolase [Neobacillus sp. NPDC058068]|uniref:TIGR01457 family HAD-type hydrolase n=1 Tax=Neobacillus sp. NPDC058068 TaxID=3346325 RepID=UPI0036D7F3F4
MKNYDGYLIDLDGTVYRGKEGISEAIDFINDLKDKNRKCLFLTNNSSKRTEEIASKLQKLGVFVSSEEVFTSGIATAAFIADSFPNARVMVIGEDGLYRAIEEQGFLITSKEPDVVVMGIDRHITYDKLAKASLAIQNGAQFISTNSDLVVPTDRGLLPANGSLTAVLTKSTGVKPIFIGKPEQTMIEQALKRLGTDKEKTLIIGDNYETDILTGIRAGIDSLLVLTGVTGKTELKDLPILPTYTLDSLEQWKVS